MSVEKKENGRKVEDDCRPTVACQRQLVSGHVDSSEDRWVFGKEKNNKMRSNKKNGEIRGI